MDGCMHAYMGRWVDREVAKEREREKEKRERERER